MLLLTNQKKCGNVMKKSKKEFGFMNYDVFSQRLKDARNKKQLTQKQLANKIGVSATTLTNYETNKSKVPGADVLISLSEVLDVSIDWLLGNDKSNIESTKTDVNNISGNDIKNALNVIFTAFGDKIRFFDIDLERSYEDLSGYPQSYNEPVKAIVIDEKNIQKYLDNYVKLLSVNIDKSVLNNVFDAIFPKGEFNTFIHQFLFYENENEGLLF